MQTRRRFRWVISILTAWTFMLLGSTARAEEQRFVHPEDATTYIEPASKSELRVMIDQHLGGTKDVTVDAGPRFDFQAGKVVHENE